MVVLSGRRNCYAKVSIPVIFVCNGDRREATAHSFSIKYHDQISEAETVGGDDEGGIDKRTLRLVTCSVIISRL